MADETADRSQPFREIAVWANYSNRYVPCVTADAVGVDGGGEASCTELTAARRSPSERWLYRIVIRTSL
jgi:hypothetical protein